MSWRLRHRPFGQRSVGEKNGTMICLVRGRGSCSKSKVGKRLELQYVRFAGKWRSCRLQAKAGTLQKKHLGRSHPHQADVFPKDVKAVSLVHAKKQHWNQWPKKKKEVDELKEVW